MTRRRLTRGAVEFRRWRLRSGLTQFQASYELRYTSNVAVRLELGINRPTLEVAMRIEEVTGIPARDWTVELPGRRPTYGRKRISKPKRADPEDERAPPLARAVE